MFSYSGVIKIVARAFLGSLWAGKKNASLCSGAQLAGLGQANGAHGRREPVRLAEPEPPTCLLMVRIMLQLSCDTSTLRKLRM